MLFTKCGGSEFGGAVATNHERVGKSQHDGAYLSYYNRYAKLCESFVVGLVWL